MSARFKRIRSNYAIDLIVKRTLYLEKEVAKTASFLELNPTNKTYYKEQLRTLNDALKINKQLIKEV